MPPWARASSLDRVLECPASAVLAIGEDTKSDAVKEAADWGTAVHYFKQHGRLPRNLLGIERHRQRLSERCAYLNRSALWPIGGTHEVTVAYDVVTGKVEVYEGPLDGADAWKESRGEACVTGTMDYLGDLLGTLWVDDLKTGRWPHEPDEPQTVFYSLAAWTANNKPPTGATATITTFPRYPGTSLPVRSRYHDLTPVALTTFAGVLTLKHDEIRALRVRRSRIVAPDVTLGTHCAFCPAKTTCPIKGH